jgi:hypothetical protein
MTQSLLKETDRTQTQVPATPSPRRRWVRFAAPAAVAAILLAIAAGVVISRSDDVSPPAADSVEEVNASDRHLLNQAAIYQRLRGSSRGSDTHLLNQAQRVDRRSVDGQRFAGRYSNEAADGSDRHLLNQAQTIE